LDVRSQPSIGSQKQLAQALGAVSEGQIDLASWLIRGVLEQAPEYADALFALGMIATMRGGFTEALDSFDRAAANQADDPQIQLQRGRCLVRLGRPSAALLAFEAAAMLGRDAGILLELADIQASMGKVTESVHTFARVLATNPDSFQANILMARALTELNRWDEAEPYWVVSEKLENSAGQTRLAKAMSLALIGRFEAAETEALQAIDRNPNRGKPYFVLIASKRVSEKDRDLIERMEQLSQGFEIGESDRLDLLYGLGKAYDELGEYALAMQRFDRGNALLRRLNSGGRTFDREGFRRSIDRQIEVFTSDLLRSVGEGEPELPLFVMGMIRSGTTLVDQILSCHPRVGGAGEQAFWVQHEEAVFDFERRSNRTDAAQKLKSEYQSLLESLAPGRSVVIDKNPANVLVAGLIHMLYPGSRLICTRRHAVDTALSMWMTQMQTGAPFVNERSDIVFAYKEYLRLAAHWQAAMPESRYREVRYESIIDNPEAQTRELVAFCGLDWTDACLRPEQNSRIIKTPSFWQVRQPVYSTSVDRWKRYEAWLGPFNELIGL
jgi:tetratricopeptide (TPR) repeat protein